MDDFVSSVDLLKEILEHLREPWMLDAHPWAKAVLRKTLAARSPAKNWRRPSAGFFRERMPSVPPRRGKRLDTRWGEFGLLATQYFAPLEFGMPTPRTQRDAWQGIDQAILLFVLDQMQSQPINNALHIGWLGMNHKLHLTARSAVGTTKPWMRC